MIEPNSELGAGHQPDTSAGPANLTQDQTADPTSLASWLRDGLAYPADQSVDEIDWIDVDRLAWCFVGPGEAPRHPSARIIDALDKGTGTIVCRVYRHGTAERILWSTDAADVLRKFSRQCGLDPDVIGGHDGKQLCQAAWYAAWADCQTVAFPLTGDWDAAWGKRDLLLASLVLADRDTSIRAVGLNEMAHGLYENVDPHTDCPGWWEEPGGDIGLRDTGVMYCDLPPKGKAWWRQLIVDMITAASLFDDERTDPNEADFTHVALLTADQFAALKKVGVVREIWTPPEKDDEA